MDPVPPLPDPVEPLADPPEVLLDAPDDPPAVDTPDNLAATGEFPVLIGPDLTLTADGGGPRDSGPPPVDSIRHAVPGYEILSELGRGGMGVVYLARQVGLDRPVALKMILSGEHAGPSERDRFRREAQAVAALQHSNIVQIYDVGEAQGRPYLAFEYVGGGTLASYLDGQPWPAKPAADLIEALARAVHFAHTRGIVHRDLKPANVLLGNAEPATRRSDKSEDPLFRVPASALRVPKITDFGLAKRFEPDSADTGRTAPLAQTRTGAVVGTPSYLAPEQAAGKNRLVGPHTDVYALGTMLYELLTGRPPFRGETPLDTVLQVMGDDPVPPAHLNRKVPRDLQTICLKCLQKDPKRRYASAEALADDLKRFQNREPILARPVGWWERAAKFMNRHPAATVLTAISAVAILSLLGVSLSYNVELQAAADRIEEEARAARDAEGRALTEKQKADDERVEAEKQRVAAEKARQEVESQKREAERGIYALQLFKAAALGERDPQRALRLLDDRNRCLAELRDFTWRYVRGQVLVTEQVLGVHQGASGVPPVARVAFSPDGSLVATVSGLDPLVRVYDVAGQRLLFVLTGHRQAAHGVAFADAHTVAAAGADHTVRLWQLPDARPARAIPLEP
ncbi:MAG: protein kinase, partial [Zavarzinella sp.]|nr:protein kinase [Zavarzinella sp.]